MNVTTIVGIEVHVQLNTRTKIFCGCDNEFNPDRPNTQTCPVCLGLPGALPVLNREAIHLGQKTGLALNCEVTPVTKWDRKQYFYPDLPKGYQTSQFDLPLCQNGWVETFTAEGVARRIRIRRAHLEEDAGKNMHDESGRGRDSQVDLNRAGTPLLEIVSDPDIRSAQEAKAVLEELHLLLTYLGVSDCNMQEGSLRCDANVNLHIEQPDGKPIATPIVEVKNLNSFRAVEAAIEFEVQRQLAEFQKTGRKMGDPGADKETRGWDPDRGQTTAQRAKEEAADYRYFPCPDLVPVTTSPERIEEIRRELPEFPAVRRSRYRQEFGLSLYDASVIVKQGVDLARYFETVVEICGDAKQAANWVTQDVQRDLNDRKQEIAEFPIVAEVLGDLLNRIVSGELTVKGAREVYVQLLLDADEKREFAVCASPPQNVCYGGSVFDETGSGGAEIGQISSPVSVSRIDAIIDQKGLKVVNDTGLLDAVIATALADSPKAVDDFKAGKQQAIGAVLGKIMKLVKGADAKVVRERLIQKLSEEETMKSISSSLSLGTTDRITRLSRPQMVKLPKLRGQFQKKISQLKKDLDRILQSLHKGSGIKRKIGGVTYTVTKERLASPQPSQSSRKVPN